MATLTVKPIPDGMHLVIFYLVCAGAVDAIEFYKRAFGAVEMMRLFALDGKLAHGVIQIGDFVVMLMDEFFEQGAVGFKNFGGLLVWIHLYVDDADAFVARVMAEGAKVTLFVVDMFWGDRYGQFDDLFGYYWLVVIHKRDLSFQEIQAAMGSAILNCGLD